jgi:hypothetical protein
MTQINFSFGKSLSEDIENLRKFVEQIGLDNFIQPSFSNLINNIIINDLKRQLSISAPAQQESAQKKPEEADYKEKFNSICKWFAFYQDKSNRLEKELEEAKKSNLIAN